MGANTCTQLDEEQKQYIDVVEIPGDKLGSLIRSPEENQEQSRQSTIQSISKIYIKPKNLVFDVLDRNFFPEKMKVYLSNDHKIFKQYQDKENRFNIYSVEFEHRENGFVNISLVHVTSTNKRSALAFAGEYNGKKKSRGVYFFFTDNEAFMFQGQFGDKENVGLKVTIGKGIREKIWGTFDSKFQANGKGCLLGYYEHEEKTYEQHFFQGTFANSLKVGKGILKIKEAKGLNAKNLPGQKDLSNHKIQEIQKQIGKNNGIQKDLIQKLVQLIALSVKYSPVRPQSGKDSEYRTIIDSQWRNNIIDGIAKETWPRQNFHFQGIYQNNQRNGYGEEYAYDQLIAKGFYRNGIMETDKDNELQLLGFRYNPNNEQWRRDKQ